MERFRYKPIDLQGRSFRLIRLFKAQFDIIRCELFDARFDDEEEIIAYEALSYTWGTTYKPHEIEINGCTMAVTENLSLALRNLRYPQKDRILWIDAICIDQNNEKERGHQVLQMASIYKRAERVVVWLGPSTTETDFALRSMSRFEEKAREHTYKDWATSDERWMGIWLSVQPLLDDGQTDLMSRQQQGLQDLLRRSWFDRVWIIQEVANARAAIVICGTKSVSAHTFALFPSLAGVAPDPHRQAILDVMPGPTRKYSWWTENRDLHTLLLKFRESKASDPRDKIYALLGISSDGCDTDFLVPDYGKNEREVIQRTVEFIFRFEGGMDEIRCWSYSNSASSLHRLELLGDELFIWAANQGSETIVKRLLDTGRVDINFRNKLNKSAISLAAENGHEAIVRLLLNTGKADVNLRDVDDQTPLSVATRCGHEAIVRLLLDTGRIDIDFKSRFGQTPLALAVDNGHEATVRLLLNTGKADVNLRDKGNRTPLLVAAENGHEAIVRLLLNTGKADVNLRDEGNRTPLLVAAQNGHEAIVRLLLDTDKTDVDIRNLFRPAPLLVAAGKVYEAIVRLLLNTGKADVNLRDKGNRTPLLAAAQNGHEAIVRLLLDTSRVDVNLRDILDRTPLLIAAEKGYEAIVRLLFETGRVDVNIRNRWNESALSLAVSKGHESIVELLRKNGADSNP